MRTYALENRGRAPLYEYLYRCIRGDILDGTLTAGERLPSKRALASHLKVSVVTVEGAYGQLLAEGYLRSEPKRGFFVQPFEAQSAPAAIPAPPSAAASVKEKSIQYDFTTNAVDTARFPFSTWARLMREVLTQEDSGLLAASHPQGVEELRQVITGNVDFACDYIAKHFNGVDVSRPQGTYMLFLDCGEWLTAHGKTMDELLAAGWDVGVIWQDGRAFHGQTHIRMNLALPLSRVQEALRRLDTYVFNA